MGDERNKQQQLHVVTRTADETSEQRNEQALARGNRIEQAFNRYCEGARPAEIGAELGVTAATVRRWLRDYLRTLEAEGQEERADRLMRAIQGQWALANEAWKAYRDKREQTGEHDSRLLMLASRAEREAARLQEVYDKIQPGISRMEFVVTRRPDGSENIAPHARPDSAEEAQGVQGVESAAREVEKEKKEGGEHAGGTTRRHISGAN